MDKELKEFNKWRRDKNKTLPNITKRVFALRDKHYMGCGFHYLLECNLGYCISMLNDFNSNYDIAKRIAAEVRFEELICRLEEIENERL